MQQQIMALCKAMGAEEGQEVLLQPLILVACRSLEQRLRRDVAVADCTEAFMLAVAMVAMDGLAGSGAAANVVAFTAGEVSIRTGHTPANEGLTARAERLLAPWLGETGFAFLGVRG